MPEKCRDYQEVADRVAGIDSGSWFDIHNLGTVEYHMEPTKEYPLFGIVAEGRGPTVLISGGVHGDEVAGVYAVLEFFEKHVGDYLDRFGFVGLPCVNPSGFEKGTSETFGINLNRQFGVRRDTETELVERFLEKQDLRYLFTMDMHETDECEGWPTECWLYETQKDISKRIGTQMIAELPPNTPVCRWPEIPESGGDQNNSGVIWYPEGLGNSEYVEGTAFQEFLYAHYTNHSFTTETPIPWDLEKRVKVHLSFLESALNQIKTD